jgi:hypothetical protein
MTDREKALVQGLRKCLRINPEAQWIDANIIRLLLRDYDHQELVGVCICKEGPKLGERTKWAKPRCGRCYKFVEEREY